MAFVSTWGQWPRKQWDETEDTVYPFTTVEDITESMRRCTLNKVELCKSSSRERSSKFTTDEKIDPISLHSLREQDTVDPPGLESGTLDTNENNQARSKIFGRPTSSCEVCFRQNKSRIFPPYKVDMHPPKAQEADGRDRKCQLVALPLEIRRIVIKHVVEYADGDQPNSHIGLAHSCRTFYYETCEAYFQARALYLYHFFKPHHFFEGSRNISSRDKQSRTEQAHSIGFSRLLNYEDPENDLRRLGEPDLRKPLLLTGLPRLEWLTKMHIEGWGFSSLMDLCYSIRLRQTNPFQFANLAELTILVRGIIYPVPCPWVIAPAEVDRYFQQPGVLPSDGGLRAGIRLMETLLGLCPQLDSFLMRPSAPRFGELNARTKTWPDGLGSLLFQKDRVCQELKSRNLSQRKLSAKILYGLATLTLFMQRSLQQGRGGTGLRGEAEYLPMTHSQLEAQWRVWKHDLDTMSSRNLMIHAIRIWHRRRDFWLLTGRPHAV